MANFSKIYRIMGEAVRDAYWEALNFQTNLNDAEKECAWRASVACAEYNTYMSKSKELSVD